MSKVGNLHQILTCFLMYITSLVSNKMFEVLQMKQNLICLNVNNISRFHNCDKLKSEKNKCQSKLNVPKGLIMFKV